MRLDFKNPAKALFASTGLSRATHKLMTVDGQDFYTDRRDMKIWEAYFSGKLCDVSISANFFKVLPHNENHHEYFIRGATGCATHNIIRYNKRFERDNFLDNIESSEKSIYSSGGEDGIIEYLLSKIPSTHNYIVEFGANDGIWMSNSRHLLHDKYWNGFLIESDNRFYKKLYGLYKSKSSVITLKSFVTEDNINSLFKEANLPYDFEVLSIDIDGLDYYVWKGLTEFKPKIVIVEYNSSISPDKEYVLPREDDIEFGDRFKSGASVLSWYKLGKEKGYSLVYGELFGSNLFFIDNKYLSNIGYPNLKVEDIYQPPQHGELAGGMAPNGRGDPPPVHFKRV